MRGYCERFLALSFAGLLFHGCASTGTVYSEPGLPADEVARISGYVPELGIDYDFDFGASVRAGVRLGVRDFLTPGLGLTPGDFPAVSFPDFSGYTVITHLDSERLTGGIIEPGLDSVTMLPGSHDVTLGIGLAFTRCTTLNLNVEAVKEYVIGEVEDAPQRTTARLPG